MSRRQSTAIPAHSMQGAAARTEQGGTTGIPAAMDEKQEIPGEVPGKRGREGRGGTGPEMTTNPGKRPHLGKGQRGPTAVELETDSATGAVESQLVPARLRQLSRFRQRQCGAQDPSTGTRVRRVGVPQTKFDGES